MSAKSPCIFASTTENKNTDTMKRLFGLGLAAMLATTVAVAELPTDDKIIGTIKGRASGLPLEFATVVVHDAATDKALTGVTTDSLGGFRLDGVGRGRYYLVCSYIGFPTLRTQPFEVGEGRETDLGTLRMDDGDNQLGEAVVEGHKSTFVAKLDRKVFNVGSDLTSQAGSAADLMQNIPSVEVDMDGTVSLRGNENVTILVNGKPSAMMSAKTRGDALSQLAAGSIERIELITNPSAAYKPDGVSGIINIVMKQSAPTGTGVTLTANAGSAGRYNAGLNLNAGLKRVNLFGGYTYRYDRYDRTITDRRTSPTATIEQDTYGLGRPESHTVRLGANSRLTDRDEVELSGAYNHRRFQRSESVTSVTKSLIDEAIMGAYDRQRKALAFENMWEGNFRYTHSYAKGNDWGIDYNYSSESEDEMNHYTTVDDERESRNDEGVWDANYLHTLRLHSTHTFANELKLSSGYEFELLRAEQAYSLSNWDGEAMKPDVEGSSDFVHLRRMHSLYVTAEMPLGRWTLLSGLRGERVGLENRLRSMATASKHHELNLYPTLHLGYRVNDSNEWQLNYSLRVNRPEGSDMNPFTERINPLSLQAGNPDLKPEKIHSIETGWLWHGAGGASLMSTLYYRYLTNEITEVSRYVDGGILLTTKENLSSSQSAGAELIWTQQIGHWLSWNWNVNGYYNRIDASKLGFGKHKSAFSWSTLINANFTPWRQLTLQVNARYRSARLVPQGRRDADCRVNVGAKYELGRTGLTLMASVTDLFDTYRKSFTLDTPELKQRVEHRRNPRIWYVGVSYQLGKHKKGTAKLEYDENKL